MYSPSVEGKFRYPNGVRNHTLMMILCILYLSALSSDASPCTAIALERNNDHKNYNKVKSN